jgi:hypothetical protein
MTRTERLDRSVFAALHALHAVSQVMQELMKGNDRDQRLATDLLNEVSAPLFDIHLLLTHLDAPAVPDGEEQQASAPGTDLPWKKYRCQVSWASSLANGDLPCTVIAHSPEQARDIALREYDATPPEELLGFERTAVEVEVCEPKGVEDYDE